MEKENRSSEKAEKQTAAAEMTGNEAIKVPQEDNDSLDDLPAPFN